MNIGKQIQEYRNRLCLTQEELAEKLDISRQAISKWELDQTKPDLDNVIQMSKIFCVTVDELLYSEEERKKDYQQLHFGSIYLVVRNFEQINEVL